MGKSISDIFSDFLLSRKAQAKHQSNPRVSAMLGSLKSYKIDDSKVGIRHSYAKKYSSLPWEAPINKSRYYVGLLKVVSIRLAIS